MAFKLWKTFGVFALLVSVTGCGAATNNAGTNNNAPGGSNPATTPSSGGTKNAQGTSKWLTVDNSKKSVDLKLEAGVNDGFNFNGYDKGSMIVTVPTGWKVNATFTNDSSAAHSAVIVPFDQVAKMSGFTPAFSGATTPNPVAGVGQNVAQKFSFTADKAGKYGIVCAVPGHDGAGMWDILVVSGSAKTASIATTK